MTVSAARCSLFTRATTFRPYLDAVASDLLREARANFSRYALDRTSIVPAGDGTLYFPWLGDRALNTLVQQFRVRNIAASAEGPAIVAHHTPRDVLRPALEYCLAERPVDTLALARSVKNKVEEKWDWAVDEEILCAGYAGRRLGVPMPALLS